ncbi:MAG: response regulator transcription factor [Chloroflexi bacterium]|nr:response regulator transcription factor [Chloroflexota bacterium]
MEPTPSQRVLLVAEDDDLLGLLEFVVARAGFATVRAPTVTQALLALSHQAWTAVVLDISMRGRPEQVIATARSISLPLVGLTVEDELPPPTLEDYDLLCKPVSPNELITSLRAHIASARDPTAALPAEPAASNTATGRVLVEGGSYVELFVACATDPLLLRQGAARIRAQDLVPSVLRYALDLARALAAGGGVPSQVDVQALIQPAFEEAGSDQIGVDLAVRAAVRNLSQPELVDIARQVASDWAATTRLAQGSLSAEVAATLIAASETPPDPITAVVGGRSGWRRRAWLLAALLGAVLLALGELMFGHRAAIDAAGRQSQTPAATAPAAPGPTSRPGTSGLDDRISAWPTADEAYAGIWPLVPDPGDWLPDRAAPSLP